MLPRLSLGQVKWFSLLFGAFFALSAAGQYLFVSQSMRAAEQADLAVGVASIERAMELHVPVDPARYFKTYVDAYDYLVVLTDGAILDIDAIPHRPIGALIGRVHCPILTDAAFDAPQTVTFRTAAIDPETWTIRAKRVKGGIAIVGISVLDEVSAMPAKLAEALTLLGDTITDVPRINFNHMNGTVHWAIIDEAGTLVSANGRLPLQTDALSLGGWLGRTRDIEDGDRTWLASYQPLHETGGRVVGVAVQLKDETLERRALSRQLWFDATVALGSFALFVALAAVYSTRHEREKRMIREAFQNYFSPPVLDAILRDPQKLALGGQRREVTILFSDIRAFTSLSEKLPPHQLTALLHDYFDAMTEEVFATEGIVDKFIGDAIMAFWGAPIEQPDQADRAVTTALNMVERLKDLQARWRDQGFPALDIGIGINLGVATVGNFGSSRRFDYTVIGDAVNAAARLEALNKDYQSRIIISDTTKNQLTLTAPTRDLGEVRVRGREQAIRVYTVDAAE